MYNQHYLETINTVLAWDLPEEAIANAISQQVTRNMDLATEDTWDYYSSQSENMHWPFSTDAILRGLKKWNSEILKFWKAV